MKHIKGEFHDHFIFKKMESARLEHARVDHNIVTTRGQPNWFVLYRAKMRRLEKEGKPRNTKNKDLHI